MRKISTCIAVSSLILALPLKADTTANETTAPIPTTTKTTPTKAEPAKPFTPFTGKITRDKVRLRLQPTLDGHILHEMKKGDMLIVMGEQDDYYAVQPPAGQKVFIFRTFVLDNTVEGNHVNVRLEPSIDAPVVAQLNNGDRIDGTISSANNKWMEITPPPSTRFYISKEYVEKVGDISYLNKQMERQKTVNEQLSAATRNMEDALQGPFEQINLAALEEGFNQILRNYPDFDQHAAKAREHLNMLGKKYTELRISYLESRNQEIVDAEAIEQKNRKLTQTMQAQQARLAELEKQVKATRTDTAANLPTTMTMWMPTEEALYEHWAKEHPGATITEFYDDANNYSVVLKGTVKAYDKQVKNKPGDFVLLNSSNVPVAYLYSTRVNLNDLIGQKVTIRAVQRANNNFAYKAYFVLSAQE